MKSKSGPGLRERLRRNKAPRTVYVGSYEDRLSRLPAMHVSPDDDGRTREDRELEQAERRSNGGSIGNTIT